MDLMKKISIFVFLLCVFIALKNQRAHKDSPSVLNVEDQSRRKLEDEASQSDAGGHRRLQYDFYRAVCPSAEKITRSAFRELYAVDSSVGPQLLRLAFHDCFISGCDASILLDSEGEMKSEKEAPPNPSIKGFEQIDVIKSRLEQECPGIVSCADIVVLVAQEAVLLAGGQFFPVLTGRLDSRMAFSENATAELPSPKLDVIAALTSFAAKGFYARETIALLGGGHSTGKIHCSFIRDRLFNFTGTNHPDPSIDADFLEVLRSECSHPLSSAPSASPSPSAAEKSSPTPSASFENRAMRMDYEGVGKGFGEVYYRSLLKGKGLLFVDQQMTSREDTKAIVEEYATDSLQFRRDFAQAMIKLTHRQGSTEGEVRLNCRRVN